MIRKFLIGNTIFLGCSLIGYQIYSDKRYDLYKNTRVFELAMKTLRSNKGAIYYLGEPIKDGKLRIADEKKEDNITTYRVKVDVKGNKTFGCMTFWLRSVDDDPDPELTRIELQIKNVKDTLLILGGKKPEKAQE